LLACALMVGGVCRIVGSLVHRFPHWGWICAGGVLNLILGTLIWQQWPLSGFWVIGLFVGIDMIFNGWTWIMLALRLKQLPRLGDSTA
ncbi:MAG: HdeD family acid-resistance protein, partial [Isosphaeraceae bacterium]